MKHFQNVKYKPKSKNNNSLAIFVLTIILISNSLGKKITTNLTTNKIENSLAIKENLTTSSNVK